MGAKITIDSASLANKGLEVIEACRLFDLSPDQVKVTVHPQSLVHSFVRTKDGVLYAQISPPDMRHPIVTALSWPDCIGSDLKELSFEDLCTMQFEPPRWDDFPLLSLAYGAASRGKSYPIAFNAANEIAVDAFLRGKTSFPGMADITDRVMGNNWSKEPESFAEVMAIDAEARAIAAKIVGETPV
jgi:1-deoxy-D-xylulose-5-phosphate reductoisomerase